MEGAYPLLDRGSFRANRSNPSETWSCRSKNHRECKEWYRNDRCLSKVGGYPYLEAGIQPDDMDHGEMPDEWKLTMGLDRRSATDRAEDLDQDGYPNLEEYLHHLLY
jgi:hypothetical protein